MPRIRPQNPTRLRHLGRTQPQRTMGRHPGKTEESVRDESDPADKEGDKPVSAPALARDRSGRRYMIPDPAPDGDPIECVSVTAILENLSKPALVNWAALEVAKYAYRERNIWHQLEE